MARVPLSSGAGASARQVHDHGRRGYNLVMSARVDALDHPVAVELLASRIPLRLAFTGLDGNPRVVPIWFHWDGAEVAVFTDADSYKARAIAKHAAVAGTIDTEGPPYRVLRLRGEARIEPCPGDGPHPQAWAATIRYLGEQAAAEFASRKSGQPVVRIAFRPSWAHATQL
jgi:Pyridoxamine 5'-phosphate oxidase